MSEATHMADIPPEPQVVAPDVLFDAEYLRSVTEEPVPPAAVATLAERVEEMSRPFRMMTPEPSDVRHQPVTQFMSEQKEGYRLTFYKYDTQEAYQNTELRDAAGQTLLATIENYRPDTTQPDAQDTFCIDRQYNAFVRREKVHGDQRLTAVMPATWNEVKVVADRLDGIRPAEPREVLGGEENAASELARQQIGRFKAQLSALPEFRRAVVDRLSDEPFLGEVPDEIAADLVKSFWEGKTAQKTNDPKGQAPASSLQIHMGGHSIELSYKKQVDYTIEHGRDGVTVEEMLDLVVHDVPEPGAWNEIYLATGDQGIFGNLAYSKRQLDAEGRNVLQKQLTESNVPELLPKVDEILAMLSLPATHTDISETFADNALSANAPEGIFGDGFVGTSSAEPANEALDEDDHQRHIRQTVNALQWQGIYYPGVDKPYDPIGVIPEHHKVPTAEGAATPALQQKAARISRVLRWLGSWRGPRQ